MEIYEGYYLWHDANFYQSPNHRNDPKTAITYYERVRSEYGLKFSLLTHNLGVAYQRVGNLDKALQMHHKTIQIDPSYDKGILNYAHVLSLQNRISESIQTYSSIVKRNPVYAPYIWKSGVALYERGEIDAAIQFFRLIVKTDPKNEQNYFILGVLFQTQGKIEDAISAYRQALSINPEHANARTALEGLLTNPEMRAPRLDFQPQ